MIPGAFPKGQYLSAKSEIDAAIARVLERGHYILGEEVAAFEREFALYVGTAHAVAVASGTDAIHLALRALGIGPGDEVITVSHTAVATVVGIEACGATPVFVDIDPRTFALDPNKLEAVLTPRTRAILPVHLYGHPVALDAIAAVAASRNIPIVEDCAQAHGATIGNRRVGSIGQAGCFSFYPTKNLGAIGDGGMVVTSDAALAASLRSLREYGWRERYVSDRRGTNSRLDEIQAAILRIKLGSLDASNAARRSVAREYSTRLAGRGFGLPEEHGDIVHVYHLYVLRTRNRDEVLRAAKERGVGVAIHYPVPVHLQPAYAGLPGSDALPETERAAQEVLSLPMYPELTAEQLATVVAVMSDVASLA